MKKKSLGKNLKNKLNCFAKRYAAKEAFAKALETGIAKGLKFNEIIIQNEKMGNLYKTDRRNQKKCREKDRSKII